MIAEIRRKIKTLDTFFNQVATFSKKIETQKDAHNP